MSDFIDAITRPDISVLTPYQSAQRVLANNETTNKIVPSANYASGNAKPVWLNANERPSIDGVNSGEQEFNRYPSFQPQQLIANYATYAGVGDDQVLACRGADEGIELLIRAFCRTSTTPSQADSIIINPPTYGMYEISAKTIGARVIKVPTSAPEFQLNTEQLKKIASANKLNEEGVVKLVFICSPNNPTGNLVSAEQIEKVVNFFKDSALVVIDEAYIEYSSANTQVGLIDKFDNVVILRTLSKAFGLAGLRCGFVLSNSAVINVLKKVIAPYPLATPVADIATESLTESGINNMYSEVNNANQAKSSLFSTLFSLSFTEKVFPSKGNFILAQVKNAPSLMAALMSDNIFIRDQSKQYGLPNCVRFTIGSESEMRILTNALIQFEKKNND
ncbi:histidinol-phosphate transaminase [Flocculibacter collagenilyticus]|uniref:histidinol-phosphate transaminase n=1 Tax=Flocculibacter collagenilyticus TaxID=2744479 RepID=UPI0018F57348|nr:histidinol-phosphate transaminase [Flocculibacter collagenilyticus]